MRSPALHKPPPATPRPYAPQSVERIFAVLDHLALQREGDSLAGIARAASAPKTSMVGLLAGMVNSGHLVRDSRGHYTLGPRLYTLAMRVTAAAGISQLAHPFLVDLVQRTGETVLLGNLAPDAEVAMYIDKVESSNPVRYTVSLGERRELYATAIGKLLLAYMDKPRQAAYLRNHKLGVFTPNTITSVKRLREELATIVEQGMSHTDSERVQGASALAAPVLDHTGRLIAGISLAGPSERIRDHRPALAAELRNTAKALSALLAGRPEFSAA